MHNKYRDKCMQCQKQVAAGQGELVRSGGRWFVICQACLKQQDLKKRYAPEALPPVPVYAEEPA